MANISTFSVPDKKHHLLERLEKLISVRNGRGDRVSKSGLLVEALEEYLDKHMPAEEPEPEEHPEMTDELREIRARVLNRSRTGPPTSAAPPVRNEATGAGWVGDTSWADDLVVNEPESSEEGTTP